jgi:zinc transport system ATP-binding protein
VRDASLAIARGEFVAVLGANGSGKSTLLRGILGVADLLGGSIELFGVPARQFHERWRLGYVPQRQSIVGGVPATVTEIVTSGRLAHRRPWQRLRARDRERVQDAIGTVGLDGMARVPVARLSGGQQRRVLIARALAGDAQVLLLDEPTAGVDRETQARLTETMVDLVARGVTVVLVAHELGPAAGIVTRTVQMRDGGIAYDGPPRAVDLRTDDVAHHDHDAAPRGFGLTG